jgi:hypothetical protein
MIANLDLALFSNAVLYSQKLLEELFLKPGCTVPAFVTLMFRGSHFGTRTEFMRIFWYDDESQQEYACFLSKLLRQNAGLGVLFCYPAACWDGDEDRQEVVIAKLEHIAGEAAWYATFDEQGRLGPFEKTEFVVEPPIHGLISGKVLS